MTPGRIVFFVALLAASFAAPLESRVVIRGQSVVPRDVTQPARPTERRIPVGTSSISGTVVSADTGRPVRGARVSVSGQVILPESATAGGRGGGATGPTVVSGVIGTRGGINATVQMSGPTAVSRFVVTDESGAFSFPRLPAGQFQLSVSHNSYLALNYGQRRPGGMGKFLQLSDGQQETLKIALDRGAVISGTVIGPDGEPQRNAQVRAMRYVRTNGFRRLQSQGYASTDDRGMYRMFGLQPGDYVIAVIPNASDMAGLERMMAQYEVIEQAIVSGKATPPASPGLPSTVVVQIPEPQQQTIMPTPAFVPTYAPGAATPASATVLSLGAGEERLSVDVVVRHAIAATVQVELSTPLEQGVQVQMQLAPDDASADGPEGGMTRDRDGRVFFRGVRPGKYTLIAQTVAAPQPPIPGQPSSPMRQLSDAQKMWARVPIEVGGDPVQTVSVMLRPARSISGLVVFDTTRPVDLSRSRVTVTLSPAPSPVPTPMYGPPPQAQVEPNGRFTLNGVVPGRYIIRATGAGGYPRSAMSGGQDTLDFMLDFNGERDVTDVTLTMADTPSELSGTLTDSAGKPAPDYAIIVAPTDNRYWVPGSRRILMTRPGPDGRFVFRALPQGAYFMAAVIDPEQGVQYDPEFLRELASASVPVAIIEGAKSTQDIRVK